MGCACAVLVVLWWTVVSVGSRIAAGKRSLGSLVHGELLSDENPSPIARALLIRDQIRLIWPMRKRRLRTDRAGMCVVSRAVKEAHIHVGLQWSEDPGLGIYIHGFWWDKAGVEPVIAPVGN